MTPSQLEWYTVILPFVLTPVIVTTFVFFRYVWPDWINSFDEVTNDDLD